MCKTVLVAAVLVLVAVPVVAGTYLMNDTGQTVYGLQVTFSEAVTITGYGDVLMRVEPTGESRTFTFSGGRLEGWAGHWLSWEPASAKLVSHEWLMHAPTPTITVQDIHVPEAYVEETTYARYFTTGNREPIEASITRRKSLESIPFWVEYEIELPQSWRLVALVNDPGLLELPSGPLASATLLDDFSDANVLSEVGTEWELTCQLQDRAKPEVCRNTDGYYLGINAAGHARLDVSGGLLQQSEGLYLLAGGGEAWTEYEVSLDGIPYTGRLGLPGSGVQLYILPFSGFPGFNPEDTELDHELEIWIDSSLDRWQGVQIQQIGFYRELGSLFAGVDAQQHHSIQFTFTSNSVPQKLQFLIQSGADVLAYSETIEFPLHQATQILLDQRRFLGDELSRAGSWNASDGDPSDSTFRIMPDAEEPGNAFLISDWPNVLDVQNDTSVSAVLSGGRFYALLYWRDGRPIRRMGFYAANLQWSSEEVVENASRLLKLGRNLGFDTVNINEGWYYGWPDEQGNFALRQHTCPDGAGPGDCPEVGWSLSDQELKYVVTYADDLGYDVSLLLRQWANKGDSDLEEQYNEFGNKNGQCWTCTSSYLYGSGEGYWNQLAHYAALAAVLPIDMVHFGAEHDYSLQHGGAEMRSFYTDAVDLYRDSGYVGLLSYATVDASPDCCGFTAENPANLSPEILDPDTCGVPYKNMDAVALTEYQILASTADSSTQEMQDHASLRIQGYLSDLYETYAKPVYIQDLVVMAYDSVAVNPPGEWSIGAGHERDDEEQRRYYVAWLRAFSEKAVRDPDFLLGLTIGSFHMSMSDQAFLGSEAQYNKWEFMNIKARLQDTIRVFARDLPFNTAAAVASAAGLSEDKPSLRLPDQESEVAGQTDLGQSATELAGAEWARSIPDILHWPNQTGFSFYTRSVATGASTDSAGPDSRFNDSGWRASRLRGAILESGLAFSVEFAPGDHPSLDPHVEYNISVGSSVGISVRPGQPVCAIGTVIDGVENEVEIPSDYYSYDDDSIEMVFPNTYLASVGLSPATLTNLAVRLDVRLDVTYRGEASHAFVKCPGKAPLPTLRNQPTEEEQQWEGLFQQDLQVFPLEDFESGLTTKGVGKWVADEYEGTLSTPLRVESEGGESFLVIDVQGNGALCVNSPLGPRDLTEYDGVYLIVETRSPLLLAPVFRFQSDEWPSGVNKARFGQQLPTLTHPVALVVPFEEFLVMGNDRAECPSCSIALDLSQVELLKLCISRGKGELRLHEIGFYKE